MPTSAERILQNQPATLVVGPGFPWGTAPGVFAATGISGAPGVPGVGTSAPGVSPAPDASGAPVALGAPTAPADAPILSSQMIEDFLQYLRDRGRGDNSLQNYRRALLGLYQYLPADKRLGPATAANWQLHLLQQQGLSARTVNTRVSILNSLLGYLGHRDWQMESFFHGEDEVQPELTRAEYLRLLSAAREQGKEKSYLLIKTMGGAGMRMQELPQLTAQAVRAGVVRLARHNNQRSRILHIPMALQQELLAYLAREGITEGPVFITPQGQPMTRTSVYRCVNGVCHDARVASEKASPRCLWQMYEKTCQDIRANVQVLIERSYERMLEEEQLAVGWQENDASA